MVCLNFCYAIASTFAMDIQGFLGALLMVMDGLVAADFSKISLDSWNST